jgi:hypothetical protein
MRIAPDGLPFTSMATTSYVPGAQPPHAGLCLDSPFALRPASKSARRTVGYMLHQTTCSRNATPSPQTPAQPRPTWPIQIP